MLFKETEHYEKYYRIGNIVMCIAFICIVTYSLMKSTPLTNLSFLKHIHFTSEILLIIGLLINSVPDCKTKNTKNMCFDLVLIAFVILFFILI